MPAPDAPVYERLRADVLFGRLAPGERLRMERLKADYGASINTLREALSRLVSQGLIVAEDQRGFLVRPATFADLEDVIATRITLEREALVRSFAAGDLDWEAAVVAAHHKLARAEALVADGADGAGAALERYNRDFHAALISRCGSQWLLSLWELLYDQGLRYRMLAFQVRDFPRDRSRQEHAALRDAALARDSGLAAELLSAHVSKGRELYRDLPTGPGALG